MVFSIAEQIAFKHWFPWMKEEGRRKKNVSVHHAQQHILCLMNYALLWIKIFSLKGSSLLDYNLKSRGLHSTLLDNQMSPCWCAAAPLSPPASSCTWTPPGPDHSWSSWSRGHSDLVSVLGSRWKWKILTLFCLAVSRRKVRCGQWRVLHFCSAVRHGVVMNVPSEIPRPPPLLDQVGRRTTLSLREEKLGYT